MCTSKLQPGIRRQTTHRLSRSIILTPISQSTFGKQAKYLHTGGKYPACGPDPPGTQNTQHKPHPVVVFHAPRCQLRPGGAWSQLQSRVCAHPVHTQDAHSITKHGQTLEPRRLARTNVFKTPLHARPGQQPCGPTARVADEHWAHVYQHKHKTDATNEGITRRSRSSPSFTHTCAVLAHPHDYTAYPRLRYSVGPHD